MKVAVLLHVHRLAKRPAVRVLATVLATETPVPHVPIVRTRIRFTASIAEAVRAAAVAAAVAAAALVAQTNAARRRIRCEPINPLIMIT